ncbi:hypothetical protein UFOVP116_153 [uncultured Caudovirales phage]|uniref:Uncharacterized protein n=1 Tax=uncultured Caudovirales phage TaxID=2100421 RepID=A0A6J5L9Y6_9CAUD|nr:hypothetical protein UFOVP116_153 [uncultured Caudovirales phage]
MKPELIKIVKNLRSMIDAQDSYLDTVPQDLQSAVFANQYTEIENRKVDMLVAELFGDLAEDVNWFLYDFKFGKTTGPHIVLECGTEYTFNTPDDYYTYLESQ